MPPMYATETLYLNQATARIYCLRDVKINSLRLSVILPIQFKLFRH